MCFSAQAPCTRDAIVTDGLHSGAGKPRTLGAAAEDAIQAPGDDFSPPPPVFDISSRNRFAPLCETDRDAVVIGDSIVRHVRATLAEGKVHTHCLPGARVLDVSVQIPAQEGLQEPDRDGTQHIARGDDHRVRTSSHVSTRTRKVQ